MDRARGGLHRLLWRLRRRPLQRSLQALRAKNRGRSRRRPQPHDLVGFPGEFKLKRNRLLGW